MNSKIRMMPASLLTLGTLLAQHPGGPGFGGQAFGGPPVTGAPFSATKTETRSETLSDGNQIQQSHVEKLYRDSEGRTRTESSMTTPSGETKSMITIFDPVAGFMAHLNPADATAMKQTLPAHPSGKPPSPPSLPAVTKTDLGTQTIAGLAATGTSTTRTIAAGTIGNSQAIVETHEVWISTELKIPIKASTIDPQHGNSTMLLSNITQGAPDAALFQIPSGYTVKDEPAGSHGGPHGMPPPGPMM